MQERHLTVSSSLWLRTNWSPFDLEPIETKLGIEDSLVGWGLIVCRLVKNILEACPSFWGGVRGSKMTVLPVPMWRKGPTNDPLGVHQPSLPAQELQLGVSSLVVLYPPKMFVVCMLHEMQRMCSRVSVAYNTMYLDYGQFKSFWNIESHTPVLSCQIYRVLYIIRTSVTGGNLSLTNKQASWSLMPFRKTFALKVRRFKK